MRNVWYIVIVIIILTMISRIFIFDSFIVAGGSMAPTLIDRDYVFINKSAYNWSEPQRKDIVVINATLPGGDKKHIIKRIIGLPEERITISENAVFIRKDREDPGFKLDEPYLSTPLTPIGIINDINLDPQEYFVLGDNRIASEDSRELGTINRWDIEGKVVFSINLKNFQIKTF